MTTDNQFSQPNPYQQRFNQHFGDVKVTELKTGVINLFYWFIHNSEDRLVTIEAINGCWDVCQMLAFLEQLEDKPLKV